MVPGARALVVMRYWKSIRDGTLITFRIKRGGTILTVTTK
jgi:hypothetical protein